MFVMHNDPGWKLVVAKSVKTKFNKNNETCKPLSLKEKQGAHRRLVQWLLTKKESSS